MLRSAVRQVPSGRFHRSALLKGTSIGALAAMLAVAPAHAQLAAVRSALGVPANVGTPAPTPTNTVTAVTPTMNQILARHHAHEARVQQAAGLIKQANAAARAAVNAAAQTVPEGLTVGGLDPVPGLGATWNPLTSAQDSTGLKVWEGASKPEQTVNGSAVQVTIDQTQSRALLSWNTFNIGENTTLTFNQQGKTDWVAVNRVVGSIDPITGRLDPTRDISPTKILGKIKADGAVYILDRAGVMFGAKSQVNLHSLLVSSLELGAATIQVTGTERRDLELHERNDSFLLRGVLTDTVSGLVSAVAAEQHHDVEVKTGAQINATGGYVILAAPKVSSGGEIKNTVGGQVSLEAGTQVDATISTGAANSADPYVRGLILSSIGGGEVNLTGSIETPQGYISLGTAQNGTINMDGFLSSTTSVSRNGKISLIGGTVNIGDGAAMTITPDTGGATIPQSADAVAAFKSSQIDIGSRDYVVHNGLVTPDRESTNSLLYPLLPAAITIGKDSTIVAPSADVSIGGRSGGSTQFVDEIGTVPTAKVDILENAVIDVSGVADYVLDASRNVLEISPAKRNELRDTPNYRDVTTDGGFTLNGQTLFVDPRLSGVRADGVAWIGSPLIEAGSLAAQIGITAPELMTSGGNVTLATLGLRAAPADGAYIPRINIASNAVVDFSGGWVRYTPGSVHYSKLLTADGRLVEISQADPNDNFVAVGNGFLERFPQLNDPVVHANFILQGASSSPEYVEGRDAGSLTIKAPSGNFNGKLHGDAVAGARQIGAGQAATGTSQVAGDIRKLQAVGNQMPSAGLLHIQSIPGADIVVGAATGDSEPGTIALDVDKLNAANLGAVSLQTSGKITIDASADLNLAAGGAFNADAGRTITINGSISAPAGSITARTHGVLLGSIFDSSDDYPLSGLLTSSDAPRMWDIVVNDGAVLSTRGRWINDSLVDDPLLHQGPGYTSGGSIKLISAPRIAAWKADGSGAVDLSGSILLKHGSLLDTSGGGYISASGNLSLSGKGGNVSLINETNYFQLLAEEALGSRPTGAELFRSSLTSFQITPASDPGDNLYHTASVPNSVEATVELSGEIRSFGFKGGGTFTLVTPDLKFGSSDGAGTEVPLDFLERTGFGTLSLSAWNTAIIDNVFSNGIVGKTGLLATEVVQIREGETLNLTQSILPSILTTEQLNLLGGAASGTDISRLAEFAPTNQLGDWDNLPAHLILGGLTELQLLGGTITGAPKASITAPKFYNAGTVRIAGGSIIQELALPAAYVAGPTSRAAIGVHQLLDDDGVDRGAGLSVVFGEADASGKFDEFAPNAAGITSGGNLIINRDLVGRTEIDRQIYYLGLLGADEGIRLAQGSVTDLSGISIRNPRAPFLPGTTTPVATGRLIDGGSIRTASQFYSGKPLFQPVGFGERPLTFFNFFGPINPNGSTPALKIVADAGASIDLSGASDTFDILTAANTFTPTQAWSNGGKLSALGGGDVTQATIDAHGGASQARGGTIEWLDPVLVQSSADERGVVSADQIQAAGFDTFVARGNVTTIGDVDLSLGRAFLLRARDYLGLPLSNLGNTVGDTLPFADPNYAISMGATGDLSITAPHIALIGIDQVIDTIIDPSGQGALALHGGSIDIFGAVAFRESLTSVLLDSDNDIRLIGVQPLAKTLTPSSAINAPSLSGQVIAGGDLTFRAAQIYATTGSGNLQTLTNSNGQAIVRPFVIGSAGVAGTVRFESNGDPTPPIPYSAGSYISVLAPHIEQAGVLRAPLGRIDLGSTSPFSQGRAGSALATTIAPTQTVTLEPGSITSVSLGDLKVPYGTTTDLTDYFFGPLSGSPLTAPPTAELRFGGSKVSIESGATVDVSGGTGDIYAYEFVSGTGGSRDVLSRFNTDAFSTTNGFQYPDGRQVYAILPVGSAEAALYDPIYSADYGNLYSGEAGKIVHLEGGNGIPAGDYLLLPGQYAMLPGAMRLVENVGAAAPLPGSSAELRDGSVIVAGTYGTAGTDQADWQRRSFVVQSQDVFRKYSRIELTSGTTRFTDIAESDGNVTPRLPADAARIVFNPKLSLLIDGNFDTDPAEGGRGSQVDIAAEVIDVVSQITTPREGALTLAADDLQTLNAASLFIGGIRTDLADGSSDLKIIAHEINVLNDVDHSLRAPEILLAVDGVGSKLNLADGASIVATGKLVDTRSGDYNVATFTLDGDGNPVSANGNTGAGAVFRLANGVDRLVNRSGALAASVTTKPITFTVGDVNLAGESLALDTSRQLDFDAGSTLDVRRIALSGDNVSFSSRTFGIAGLVITPELEQAFAVAESLTIRANSTIGFTAGTHNFRDLTLLGRGVKLIRTLADADNPLTVTLNADNVTIGNKGADAGACRGAGAFTCGVQGNSFVLNSDTLTFSSGTFRTFGFDSSVELNATDGMYYNGVGTFDVASADLSLTTPFIVDRGSGAQPKNGDDPEADLQLLTTGNVVIAAGSTAATPTGAVAPGSRLAIGTLDAPAQSITIDGALLRATAGTIEAYSETDVSLTGAAKLETPSYSQKFGDAADQVTVSANGGTITLAALTGDISLGDAATLFIGGETGEAGTINLFASQGAIDLAGTIDAAAPGKGASLSFDAQLTGFDLPDFLTGWGSSFTGDIYIRTDVGDLTLDAGQTLVADNVSLTADGGSTIIGGTIDTSGVNGGDIALFARDRVSLLSSAVLDVHATGYAEADTRSASAGDVILGVGQNGGIDVATGAKIDVRAARPGDRLVPQKRIDPRTLNTITAYTYVEGDQGGTLTLRAPVIAQSGSDTVDVNFAGNVTGARDVTIQGYIAVDLAAIADNPNFSGVTIDSVSGAAVLDLASVVAGKSNFLADLAPGTLVDFIQNFDISAARSNLGMLSGLDVYHERPGVELNHSGDITLASNWNLGAGTVDAAAIAASIAANEGIVRNSAIDGFEVVPGQEGEFFRRFVSMTYRVGGRIDGEAGILTLRAGGDLNINHSITDGFFSFADQTHPDYIDSQLGGGIRPFFPAITVQCGVGGGDPTDCTDVLPFDPTRTPSDRTSINLNLTNIVRGSQSHPGIAPYSELANSPAALGLFPGGAGDPIGGAQIFPLLADGTPVDSFSIQLVGGAGPNSSANPLHIERGSGGSVIVSGESTYALQATQPVGVWGGPLQLAYRVGGQTGGFISGDFFAGLAGATGLDPETLSNSTAHVQFGAALPEAREFMRDAAEEFFAGVADDQIRWLGPGANRTGFDVPLSLLLQFLQSTDASGVPLIDRFSAMINDGSLAYNNPAPFGVIDPPGAFARVRTLVRTGTGSIDVAAARDVDLTNGNVRLLGPGGQAVPASTNNAAQAGGTSIYTAGHVIAPTMVAARVAGTQDILTIDPTNSALTADLRDPLWVPGASGRLQVNPVYATGGGSISVTAGGDVLGRRDIWSESFNSNNPEAFVRGNIDHNFSRWNMVGSSDQRWRVGSIGTDTLGNPTLGGNIRINPQLFSSGIGTLGGGDVEIDAGHDVSEMTIALDTTVTTGTVGDSFGSMVFGGGNLSVSAGHDILGGRFDISTGTAEISAGRDVGSSGKVNLRPAIGVAGAARVDNLPEIRVTDATVNVTAGGSVQIGKISALGVDRLDGEPGAIDHIIDQNALGYYTGTSGVSIQASGNVSLAGESIDFRRLNNLAGTFKGTVMPASLEVTSFNGDIGLGNVPLMLYPSATGQLSLLAGGTLAPVTISLDDGEASLMPGLFSALKYDFTTALLLLSGRPFSLPVTLPTTSQSIRRLYHAENPLHAGDDNPVRIAVGGNLVDTTVFSAKSARVSAGGDIVNMMFVGQNLDKDDVTRIVAGRDITATVVGTDPRISDAIGRSIVRGNQFIVGGPGALYVEAGRNLGPFLGSSTIIDPATGKAVSYPGGILAVGNDYNPWLPAKSADIYAFFGVANGMDFEALRETYVNPANAEQLDDDLFEQVSDEFGNQTPDRTKPIYSPILIAWMKENQADALIAAFGTTEVTVDQAYTVFAALPELVQRKFLLAKVYFNELEMTSRPDGPSFQQYVRGYRAVDTLFPASLGYTANDLSGDQNGGTRVQTGNLDLRLATIQTTRGSDITILGPGGDAILGSVVRTSEQAARRAYQPPILEGTDGFNFRVPVVTAIDGFTRPVIDIPIGYEGVLTLRGGAIRGFTDGDFRLNQSRLFTMQSGLIDLWSSNGDLNAGQGPKSAANVPPIVVRFDLNGSSEVDSAGAVTGAGIAGFTGIRRLNAFTGEYELIDSFKDSDFVEVQSQLAGLPSGSTIEFNGKTYLKDAPSIALIAPVGTVDAGDAGVRAGGDVFVAAARVANADNFKVGGKSVGIPAAVATAPPTPANAASALTANVFRAANPNPREQSVRILVDVLGYDGSNSDTQCPPESTDPNCKQN